MRIYKKTNVFCPHYKSELELNEDIYITAIDGTEFDDVDYYEDVNYYWKCPNYCNVTVLDDDPNYDKEIDRIIGSKE